MRPVVIFALLLFVASDFPLEAQTSTGEMSITVLDASGGVIPQATVTVTGSETGNTVRSLLTNGGGLAAVPLLPPNRASSHNDVRLRCVLAGSFELPFGKGKRLLNNSKAGSAIASGWRVVPIYQVQTGLPFTPALSFDAANAGTVTRPNRVCDGNLSSPSLQNYFDMSCFAAEASYVFGNSGQNVLRAPVASGLAH